MTIATVTAITGQAWARDADGNLRELSIGDTLQDGEVLVTADGARVELDFGDNLDPTVIQGGQEVAMTPDLGGEEAVAEEEASALDEDLEALLTAIDEGEGDLLAELDPTAAGAGPGGGAEGGHSFVMLARITEPLSPLSYAFGMGTLDSGEFPEDTFLAQAEEDSTPTVTALDLNGDGDTVWESALEEGSGGGVATTAGAFQIDTGSDELALIEVQDAAGNWVTISAAGTEVQGAYGVLSVNPDGSWTYTLTQPLDHPLAGQTGASDQVPGEAFAVRVTDDDGDVSAPATLSITITDDGPAAVDDAVGEIAEDSSVDIDVFANDTAGADSVDLTTGVAVATAPTQGSVVYNNDGTFTYTANAGAEGSDSFTYTLTDADGDTSTATVTLSIAEDSTPTVTTPDLNEDGDTVWESALADGSGQGGAAITTTVTGTFQITTGADTLDQIEVQDASGTWVVIAADGTTVSGDYGTLTVDTDGSWSYTLSDNTLDHDTADAILGADQVQDLFDVRVTDSDGDVSDPATLTIDVNDDGPVAYVNTDSAAEGEQNVSGNVLTDGDTADVFGADGADAAGGVVGVALGDTGAVLDDSATLGTQLEGTYGYLTLNADGSYDYDAKANITVPSGAQDVFTYTIKDGDGDLAYSTLTIDVADSGLMAPDDDDVTVDEAALDTNALPDGDDLAVGTVTGSLPGSPAETANDSVTATGGVGTLTYSLVGSATGTYGQIQVNSDGSYTYTLTSPVTDDTTGNDGTNVVDNADSFTYQVADANGNTETGTIYINIQDDVPTAYANTDSAAEGEQNVSGNVLTDGDTADVFGADGADAAGGVVGVALGDTGAV
ncbi:retention module-containing protein, partial [Halomonas sp. SSL-5]|uniref:retention module-containing protein n=1 Tax=Halomonas sp. SSL-5 TaxID=3065855 RepID=UPI0027390B08